MMRPHYFYSFALLVGVLLLAACSPDAGATPTNRPTLTPFPTYVYTVPTAPPAVATAAATVQAARVESGLNPTAVARGLDRYTVLECGTCHGENGEGTGDGPALVEISLSEDQFITFLRTGGTLGNAHLYSTDRVSDSGGRNLYQYIVSLGEGAEQTPDA